MTSLLFTVRAATASVLCAAFLSACSMHQSLVSVPVGGGASVLPQTSAVARAALPDTALKKPIRSERPRAVRAPVAPMAPVSFVMPKPVAQAAAPVLRVRNLETGATQDAGNAALLAVVNGSRLEISVAGAEFTSGAVIAGESTAALVPAGKERWSATVRYIDSSNPPALHPALQIQMQTMQGSRAFRIPIAELHQ